MTPAVKTVNPLTLLSYGRLTAILLGASLYFGSGQVYGEERMLAPTRSLSQIREKGEMLVAVYRDYAPYSEVEADKLTGVDVDLGRALATKLGVRVAFKLQAAADDVEADLRNAVWRGHPLDRTTADVMLHIPVDPALSDKVDEVSIFGPYAREDMVVAARSDAVDLDKGMDAFRKTKVGVEMGSLPDVLLLMHDHHVLLENVIHYKTLALAIDGMRSGEVSAVMGMRAEMEHVLSARESEFAPKSIPLAGVARSSWKIGAAVKSDNTTLKTALEKAMGELLADGTIARIYGDHGLTYLSP